MDGRLGYVFTRQPSIKSMNFLDLGARGRLVDDTVVREEGEAGGGIKQLEAGLLLSRILIPTMLRHKETQ